MRPQLSTPSHSPRSTKHSDRHSQLVVDVNVQVHFRAVVVERSTIRFLSTNGVSLAQTEIRGVDERFNAGAHCDSLQKKHRLPISSRDRCAEFSKDDTKLKLIHITNIPTADASLQHPKSFQKKQKTLTAPKKLEDTKKESATS